MTRSLDDNDRDTLEGLVDRRGLASVVAALAGIAHEKAEHIRTNWQDEMTARAWGMAADALDAAAEAPRIVGVSR